MNQDQISEIELNVVEAKKLVALGKALDRLLSNRDFKKVIQEGYLRDEAVRLVHYKADFNAQDPDSQAATIRQIDAIGVFTSYLNKVSQQAYLAEKAIEDSEEAIDELRAEGLAE